MSDKPSAAEAGEAVAAGGTVLTGPAWNSGISPAYRNYILVVLTLVYVVNYLDRQILGILMPLIKKDFTLTDLEVGVLTGPAFAVIYATLGIPLAVLADRSNRRNIIAASLAMFSFMTVLCGYAGSYIQLLFARFGTGIGEAGTGPSINSVIADLYPPQKRASAISFYTAGLNIGLLIGFFGGGWVAQTYGWREGFLAAGVPGLLLAVLLMATVREPRRGLAENLKDSASAPTFLTVAKYLWGQKSFRWMAVGTSFSAFGGYAGIAFIPLFLTYSHHMSPAQIGFILALFTGVFGAVGTFMAGVYADRYGKKDVRWNLYVPIIATFIAVPFAPVFYLSGNTTIALAAAIVPSLMGATYVGPAVTMAQGLVPLRMRASSVAILLFILNMIGLGLGPPVVGKISDLLRPFVGTDSIRYAMLISIVTGLTGAYCYWRATRTLKSDLARVAQASGN